MASILEELERIMGHHLKDHVAFTCLVQKPTPKLIEKALSLDIREVASNVQTINNVPGFPSGKKFP